MKPFTSKTPRLLHLEEWPAQTGITDREFGQSQSDQQAQCRQRPPKVSPGMIEPSRV